MTRPIDDKESYMLGDYENKRIETNCSYAVRQLVMREPNSDGSWPSLYIWALKRKIVDQEILLNYYRFQHDARILSESNPKECICK